MIYIWSVTSILVIVGIVGASLSEKLHMHVLWRQLCEETDINIHHSVLFGVLVAQW